MNQVTATSNKIEASIPYIIHDDIFDSLVRIGAIPADLKHMKGTDNHRALISIGLTNLMMAAEFMADDVVKDAIAARSIVQADKKEKEEKDKAERLKQALKSAPMPMMPTVPMPLQNQPSLVNSPYHPYTGVGIGSSPFSAGTGGNIGVASTTTIEDVFKQYQKSTDDEDVAYGLLI
jgi:hypothetical protein